MTAPNYKQVPVPEIKEFIIEPEVAAESTARFRATMEASKENKAPSLKKFRKGYFLPTAVIQELLSQNGGDTSGIKVYFGQNSKGSELLLELIFVATHNVNGEIATDFNVPEKKELFSTKKPAVAVARPCPHECGAENALNKDDLAPIS